MCPACLTTAALMLAGATSMGGIAAILAKKRILRNNAGKAIAANSNSRQQENQHE